MLAPHWLDRLFQHEVNFEEFIRDDKFTSAFDKARLAYIEHEKFMQENPDIYGASPAQKARLVFLEELR